MKYNKYVVSENIKTLRAEKGITAFELSEALDCSISHISQIEQGRRKMSVELLCELTDFFNTDANSILGKNCMEEDKTKNTVYIEETSQSNIIADMTKVKESFEKLPPVIQEYLISIFQHMVDEMVQHQSVMKSMEER